MKIAYNPKTAAVITTATAANDDILFDLNAKKVWAKGLRMGADWADISSKPSSLKNPYALTISLNGTSQGPYDGSAAKNINITPSSIGAATSGHTHDGRYLRWNGSTADISAMGWGTLTAANGYTILSHAASSDGGDMGFVNKGGQIFMQLDGYYYLREGKYRVLDTSDFTAFSNAGSLTTRITIGGITKDLKIDADLLDGWHLDSIRKNVGYSWSAKYRINNWSRIIKIDNLSNILLAINFSQNGQASNHLYLISTGYGCGNIVQLGANGYNSNSAIKIRLTENTATSHNVEIYSTYGHNGATELSINCNYTRIDGNSTITTYLTYTAGGGTVRKEITSSYSKIVANLQGNSDTTTKLQTPRQINGTNFDGSANITTSYWGTTRTISLTGAITGSVSTNGGDNITINTTYGTGNITNLDSRYLKRTGDTMSGTLSFSPADSSDLAPKIYSTVSSGLTSLNFEVADDTNDRFVFKINYWENTNTTNIERFIINWNNVISKAPITAPSFIGNASTATKLQTPRTIWGQSFDGTADITGVMTINPPTISNGSDNTLMFKVYSSTGYKNGFAISSTDNVTRLYAKPFGNGARNALEIHTYNNNADVNAVTIDATGNVGIGTTTPAYKLDVIGDTKITGSIRDLTIGGGIYWNPYVESASDSSDAASITLVRLGIAGGTTLVLSLMNDANDTILFQTNGSARLYHNNNFILTSKDTKVTSGKGYIDNTEITQVNNASKLQTARNLWGNSFDGTKDINGSIIFPNIGDTAISNKISWSGSSDGADIYYLTTATDLGNLVLNVTDDTNAYIQLALNGTFKSHFDVANSYWTGRSAQADKWTTARTFTIGNTAKNVDGSGNVSWSLSEIGVRDTWRAVQVNDTSIGNNTLNLCGSTYIGLTNVNGKVTFSLIGSSTTANQAILSNGTANGWTLKTLNIANWDAAYNLRHSHANKPVLDGITSGLVTNWNTAYTFVSTITGEDADKVINKWDEIVNFLAGITEDNKLNTLLNNKLSVYKLADNTNVGTIKNNGIYYSTTDASSGTLTNSPFNTGFALINMTSYDGGDDLRRSRLAFNAYGEIKVSDDRDYTNTAETWYNVLTSKNSGINGSTIKLNGTSITVYSSGTADSRYVKKSGDTMSGALNFANNTWNQVGDDVAIGDHNVAGCLGIKGLNASPGLAFYNSSNTLLSKLIGTANLFLRVSGNNTYNILDNSTTHINNNTITINGTSLTVSESNHTHNIYAANENYGGFTKSGRLPISGFYQSSESESSGGNAPWSSWIHLINCLHNNTYNNYALLIAASFFDNNIFKIRVTNNNVNNAWRDIIHSGNIGSQSVNYANSAGNSDKLDGYHASGLLTALSNSNRGISLTVGGTTKSLSNISVGDADTVDGKHATAFLLLKNNKFSQHQNGNWTKILKFNIPASSILASISFTWHPSECARDVWADFSINIRSGGIIFYGLWKSHTKCTLKCVGENGEYSVWVKGDKNSWDPFGVIQITQTWDIISYEAGSLAYQDTTPTGTSSADVTTGGYVLEADTIDGYHASNLFTGLSNSGNSIKVDIGGTSKTLQVNYANSAGSATKVIVNLHTANDSDYPLVWSNLTNANNATENQLHKSWLDLYYNPKNKRLFVGGSISTVNINATGIVTSAGFKHSGVTENANLYVLTAGGGYTFLNLTSNELAHEFSKDITVTSEWLDIEDFYGGNLNFLTLPGTYIVLVYYTTNSANSMYEGYFSGIMSWYTGTTNSNNADEIVLHRVGHAYANTIYLRTRESLKDDPHPYTKLQISANSDLKQHTYKFKFKRIC